ncbi:MAG: GGDEF domain-containing protein [Ruminiclostridium sp.]|nr:GGDEF domain-containing protein [Ruminiclostridium sp.]
MKRNKSGIGPIEALKKLGVRTIVISLFIAVFFITLMTVLFYLTYSSVRESIVTRGELDNSRSAERFNRYLVLGKDSVMLADYHLNKIIAEGRPNEDALEYMRQQTDGITNALDNNFTGIYGYIRGEYLDGSDWIPDEDYVPTERPWYTETAAENGELTIVDPYLDAQTGTVMMTISKMLDDNESVVALDIGLSKVQEITEEIAAQTRGTIEMVLDGKGGVVAHSNKNELGHNYLSESDTLGAAVADKLYNGEELSFEISFKGKDYVIYSSQIENEWYCVSVINSSIAFLPLKVMISVGVVTLPLTIFILLVIFVRTSRNTLEAERLNIQLTCVADIYMSMHDIDLVKNTYRAITLKDPDVEKMINACSGNADSDIIKIMENLSSDMSREEVKLFVELGTLSERLGSKNTLTLEYLKANNMWCRARFVVAERVDGKLTRVLFMVESIDEEKRKRDKLQYLSETDRMTGVNNRGSGEHKIRAEMASGTGGMFLLLDADKFKHINDTYGHSAGDKVLIAIAYCMRRAFRSNDIVMRLGGDEFAIYASGITDRKTAEEKINRLFNNIYSVNIPELDHKKINVSVGVAFYMPGDKYTFDELYKHADKGTYESKKHNGCFASYYNNETGEVEV